MGATILRRSASDRLCWPKPAHWRLAPGRPAERQRVVWAHLLTEVLRPGAPGRGQLGEREVFVDVDEDPHTIGHRVRQIRYSRGKSLRVVAGLAGMSKSKLSMIERGEVALDSRSDIVALANALQIAPSELTKVDVPAPGNGESDAVTAKIRCAMQGALVGAPDGRVCPIEQLSVRVDAVGRLKQRCAHGELGAMLPELIGDLYASIAAGRNDAELLRLAVELHTNGTQTYLHVMRASDDLRLVAAGVGQDAPESQVQAGGVGVCAGGVKKLGGGGG